MLQSSEIRRQAVQRLRDLFPKAQGWEEVAEARIKNVTVVVEDWADDETLAEMGIEPPDTLYGLYRGIDLTRRDSGYGNVLPDTVTIYQGPIEEDCDDEVEMVRLVRETVIHEIGHYFGLDDDTMHRIEDGEL